MAENDPDPGRLRIRPASAGTPTSISCAGAANGDSYGFEVYKSIRMPPAAPTRSKRRRSTRPSAVSSATVSWRRTGATSPRGGRRKYYRITDSGRAVYAKNLADWTATQRIINTLLTVKVTAMNTTDPNIHRLLDQAFAGVAMTPETQDLKEEIRGNLVARVAELQAGGMDAAKAGSTAVRELGDVRELVDAGRHRQGPQPAHRQPRAAEARLRARARSCSRSCSLPAPSSPRSRRSGWWSFRRRRILLIGLLAFALPVGLVTADALRQETTVHHRLACAAALLGFGAAALALAAGLVFAGSLVHRPEPALAADRRHPAGLGRHHRVRLASGVTQTNRTEAHGCCSSAPATTSTPRSRTVSRRTPRRPRGSGSTPS